MPKDNLPARCCPCQRGLHRDRRALPAATRNLRTWFVKAKLMSMQLHDRQRQQKRNVHIPRSACQFHIVVLLQQPSSYDYRDDMISERAKRGFWSSRFAAIAKHTAIAGTKQSCSNPATWKWAKIWANVQRADYLSISNSLLTTLQSHSMHWDRHIYDTATTMAHEISALWREKSSNE
jgi:hypothetical protein